MRKGTLYVFTGPSGAGKGTVLSRLLSEDEKLFFLSVEMLGVFKCEGVESEEDKKQIHTQCYDQLFPYMQSEVSHLCTASGMNGLVLRKAKIDPSQVVFNKAKKEEPTLPIV